jgi:hypothetical protein
MSEVLAISREEYELIEREQFMPVLSIESAVKRFNILVEFVKTVMRKDVDFGVIPGTDKPILLKPGAEKLCTLFGLSSRFQLIEKVEDWTGKDHDSEPFFYYLYRCQLYRQDHLMTEADGSCNSFEQKYRWRQAERQCPACGKNTIIKGKEEYGGGYLCFTKKGGCGAKFRVGEASIENQPSGRVSNKDIYDQVNTIQKIAQKRSLIGAVLLGVNASEFFTQDLEDMPIYSEKLAQSAQPLDQNTEEARLKLVDRLIRLRNYEFRKLGRSPANISDLNRMNLDEIRLAYAETEARVREMLINSIFDLHAELTILDPKAPKSPNLASMSLVQLDSHYQAMEAHLKSLQRN